ncbi:papain family cysteine protease domain-containing protein [Ditylenchus destructor]|uniref:Papain family cysteine protease domain-containing protein n=1 Tax=Ditylenchus destructor TaxID=166010 RepID=A0AAD4MPQ7_9BILA|nr:papain family cysteine protease domain-containing protein [Ditylenchus destructor]
MFLVKCSIELAVLDNRTDEEYAIYSNSVVFNEIFDSIPKDETVRRVKRNVTKPSPSAPAQQLANIMQQSLQNKHNKNKATNANNGTSQPSNTTGQSKQPSAPPALPQSSKNNGSPQASSQKSQSSSLPNTSQPPTASNTVGQPPTQIKKKAAVTNLKSNALPSAQPNTQTNPTNVPTKPAQPSGLSLYLSHPSNQNIPKQLNLADLGFIGDVKNQGLTCGSCWALVAAKIGEALHFKATGRFLKFSAQYFVDCDIHETNGIKNEGCISGNAMHAFYHIRANGIALESSYPYADPPKQSPCYAHTLKDIVRLQDILKLTKKLPFKKRPEEEIFLKTGVAKYGPLIVGINASLPSFKNHYGSHVYADVACRPRQTGETGHMMILIGYGTDPVDGDFWWLLNSWGTGWAYNGFVKMAAQWENKPFYKRKGVERLNKGNMCGIANYVYRQTIFDKW